MKDNRDLLKEVQEALANDTKLKNSLADVYVLVYDGAVILGGSVNNAEQKKWAGKIVSEIPGVNLLIEDIKTEPKNPHRVGVQLDWASGNMALSY
jgi:osmotically-inducible protein OsmY